MADNGSSTGKIMTSDVFDFVCRYKQEHCEEQGLKVLIM